MPSRLRELRYAARTNGLRVDSGTPAIRWLRLPAAAAGGRAEGLRRIAINRPIGAITVSARPAKFAMASPVP